MNGRWFVKEGASSFHLKILFSIYSIYYYVSVSDPEKSVELTIPDDYDGNIGLWMNDRENYFFTFKNAPKNVTPFVQKNPKAEKPMVSAEKNVMIAGVYYNIEPGRENGMLWMSIDGIRVFETIDKNPLAGGHVALRLIGTTGFVAGCLIKNLEVLSR